MLGFYEEMADLAAMNEDDGFLGQCASSEIEKCPPEEKKSFYGLPAAQLLARKPLQLSLSAFGMSDSDTKS
jgi:hypothetical protein